MKKLKKNIVMTGVFTAVVLSAVGCGNHTAENSDAGSSNVIEIDQKDIQRILESNSFYTGNAGNSGNSETKEPEITGVKDRVYAVGEKILYMSDVAAMDSNGNELEVIVDKSAVAPEKPGKYKVHYSTQDKHGNKAEKSVEFQIVEDLQTKERILAGNDVGNDVQDSTGESETKTAVEETTPDTAEEKAATEAVTEAMAQLAEQQTEVPAETPEEVPAAEATLDGLVAQVLSQITDDSMSMGAKARAIFNYVHTRVRYAGSSIDGADWQNEAYQGLSSIIARGSVNGDCYTYCSVDLALLQGIGAQCIWVDNYGATTGDHSWLLCDLGSGMYHFDSTRMYDGFECFMLTDDQVQAYINAGNSIYRRIRENYPDTPVEPYAY